MEATSGSYLDRMESFLSKHDNASLTDLVKEDENADNYEVIWNFLTYGPGYGIYFDGKWAPAGANKISQLALRVHLV